MMRHSFENVLDIVNLILPVLCDNLEWSEQFGCQQFELLVRAEVLKRHEDSSRLIRTINLGNVMLFGQGFSSEQNFGSLKFKDSVDMGLNLFVVPRKDRPDREVLQVSLGCLRLDKLKEVGLCPVLVHEHD